MLQLIHGADYDKNWICLNFLFPAGYSQDSVAHNQTNRSRPREEDQSLACGTKIDTSNVIDYLYVSARLWREAEGWHHTTDVKNKIYARQCVATHGPSHVLFNDHHYAAQSRSTGGCDAACCFVLSHGVLGNWQPQTLSPTRQLQRQEVALSIRGLPPLHCLL
jgi:hypothetical protein